MANDLTVLDIVHRTEPPRPWAEGDNIPWNEAGFSERMLAEHLSDAHDMASRRDVIVDRHVAWLDGVVMNGRRGRVLDLACGPGLYATRLAQRGFDCVGIDFSPASIRYAEASATQAGLRCEFVEADLRTADFGGGFDLALLLFGQFNVFPQPEALELLHRARLALKPGGILVLEPQRSESIRGDGKPLATWSSAERGLFSERPHLLLHERFWDEATRSGTERWHVVDAESGAVTRYAFTNEGYERDELAAILKSVGFSEVECFDAPMGEQNGADDVVDQSADSLFVMVARV